MTALQVGCLSLTDIQRSIHHAAHLLPAQGPITVFVHHNTLHALEDQPFAQAVREGARIFGCRPYLTQRRFQEAIASGRIRQEDIHASLLDCLGDQAEIFVGLLGTRFQLRHAILQHTVHEVVPSQLDWVIAQQQALERFSADVSAHQRQRLIASTRRWYNRTFANNGDQPPHGDQAQAFRKLCLNVFNRQQLERFESWDESAWETLTVRLLWQICLSQVAKHPPVKAIENSLRHRDLLLEYTGVDCDELVHEFLIRFCVAVLDQGLSRWQIPARNSGVMAAFVSLYARRLFPKRLWLRGLAEQAQRFRDGHLSPLESIRESLLEFGVTQESQESYIRQSALALRGFAGMIWQVEKRRDRIAHPLPEGALVEFLAIRLVLDRLAAQYVARTELQYQGPLRDLPTILQAPEPTDPMQITRCEAYRVFQLAQALGWPPEVLANLSEPNWAKLLDEIRLFDEPERLHVYQCAYERCFRNHCLDAISTNWHQQREQRGKLLPGEQPKLPVVGEAHSAASSVDLSVSDGAAAEFDIITCIDEREESFRRHVEEVAPQCRTWGAAGFFGVAMYYRAADSFQYVPLCPIVVEPQHYVQEVVTYDQKQLDQRRSTMRRWVGAALHRLHAGSRMLLSGALTSLLGTLTAVPLVIRVLFPRRAGWFRHHMDQFYSVPAQTYLQLESTTPSSTDVHPADAAEQPLSDTTACTTLRSFTLDEMATIVQRLLRDIGYTSGWSRLVVIVGHGSTTMNNPHESAYDCGACGGGRGGPNARAIAQMANDPRVRQRLAAQGLVLPETTFLLGAFHNTCNDSVTFADLSKVPATHTRDVSHVRQVLAKACMRNARERCRRFESAVLHWNSLAAQRHVMDRSEDLSEARPECGHATNALVVVGRREHTRGLFMDRRAFMHSYDPNQDDAQYSTLARILGAVVPVCAGINLEYYFSHVDSDGYGCGTKLPHNIASLVGVMNGAASDLRPGLPWQMVEIHEPIRLLFVVESTPQALRHIMANNPGIGRLVFGQWIHMATLDGSTGQIQLFRNGDFEPYTPESTQLTRAPSSAAWYSGSRDHLDFARIDGSFNEDNAETTR
ncbi:MAG: DUF2309 domain-containing protein [Pirellulaceae bacterium]|nr:DUF2309 domain-containing protein [Pirellulaceae bacterium]